MRILLRMAKAAVNLSISDTILQEARALKINLSQVLEEGLRDRLKRRQAEEWLEENRGAIKAYHRYIEKRGIFGDDEARGF